MVSLRAGKVTQRQWVKSGGSFLSQSSLYLTFGLGDIAAVDEVEVLWPDGHRDRFAHPPIARLTVLTEGSPR
jgi:hypothetical protein